jgi:uncharacterized membrane protein YbhN (UPF0104 family)
MNWYLTLSTLVIISFLVVLTQSLFQNQILKFMKISSDHQFKNLIKSNLVLYSPTLLIGYLVFPLQIFIQQRILKMKIKEVLVFGFLEVILGLVSLIIALIPLVLIFSDEISFQLNQSSSDAIIYIFVFLCITFVGTLVKKIANRKFAKNEEISIAITIRSIKAEYAQRLYSKKEIWKLLPLSPFVAVTFVGDSMLFVLFSQISISLEVIGKITLVLAAAYILGLISQVPGGLGVRESSAAVLLSQLDLGSVLTVIATLTTIRISKVVFGVIYAVVGLFWMHFSND